jgi:hypothetical protein
MFKRCDDEGDDWMDTDYEDDFWEYALTLDLGINRDGLLIESVSSAAPISISHESV